MARFLQKLGFGTNSNSKNKQAATAPRPDFIRNVQDPRGVQVLPVSAKHESADSEFGSQGSVGRRSKANNRPANHVPTPKEAANSSNQKKEGNINSNIVAGKDTSKGTRGVLRLPSSNTAEVPSSSRNRIPSEQNNEPTMTKPENISNQNQLDINRRKSPPRRQRSSSGGKATGNSSNMNNSGRDNLQHTPGAVSVLPVPPVPAPRDKHRLGLGLDGGNVPLIGSSSPDTNRANLRRESPQVNGDGHSPNNRMTSTPGSNISRTPKSKPDVVVLSEYSDPADFKRIANEKIYSEEDYTEPYELQKLKNSFQSQNLVLPVTAANSTADTESSVVNGVHSSSQPRSANVQTVSSDMRPAEEYDAPWEYTAKHAAAAGGSLKSAPLEVGSKLDGGAKSLCVSHQQQQTEATNDLSAPPSSVGGSQQQRQQDGRPTEEYDTPWEWVAHRNTDAAAAALAQDGKKRASNLKLTISTAHPVVIDANIPIDKQKWYHGAISRCEAEELLKSSREGSFLVRQSESNKQDYSLSLKSAHGFMHMKIVHETGSGGSDVAGEGEGETGTGEAGQWVLGQYSSPFPSIPAMISFYTEHKLPIRGAEHMSLIHPVHEQLL